MGRVELKWVEWGVICEDLEDDTGSGMYDDTSDDGTAAPKAGQSSLSAVQAAKRILARKHKAEDPPPPTFKHAFKQMGWVESETPTRSGSNWVGPI